MRIRRKNKRNEQVAGKLRDRWIDNAMHWYKKVHREVRTGTTRNTEENGMSMRERRRVKRPSIEWSCYMTMHLLREPFACVASDTRAASLKTSVTPRLCLAEHSAEGFQVRGLWLTG